MRHEREFEDCEPWRENQARLPAYPGWVLALVWFCAIYFAFWFYRGVFLALKAVFG